jgi:anti-anti-sigma regulatory factor
MKPTSVFTVSQHGDVLVAALNRDAGNFAEAEVVRETSRLLERLKTTPVAGVVVDFANADYFGSTMLESLRLLWTRLRGTGARLVLCSLSEVGLEILKVAHFDTVWPICATRDEAIEVARERPDEAG